MLDGDHFSSEPTQTTPSESDLATMVSASETQRERELLGRLGLATLSLSFNGIACEYDERHGTYFGTDRCGGLGGGGGGGGRWKPWIARRTDTRNQHLSSHTHSERLGSRR